MSLLVNELSYQIIINYSQAETSSAESLYMKANEINYVIDTLKDIEKQLQAEIKMNGQSQHDNKISHTY
jgi:hypothetical protein